MPIERSRVEVWDVGQIRFREGSAPRLSDADLAAMDDVWESMVRGTPELFDGPAVRCADLRWDAHRPWR
ncbi:hypothetical protein [Actinomadura oligospora]|uniref:hypothetical protein n=1 Tax=Actinomadura oligospora TaxID=111804 RepID=UPI0004BAD1B9|nr:hypothetical protein [Actinomadura oligospora]